MYDFRVDDMTCGHCVSTVEKAIRTVDAAADVRIDLAAKKVQVDSPLPPETFTRAIESAGYTPFRRE